MLRVCTELVFVDSGSEGRCADEEKTKRCNQYVEW